MKNQKILLARGAALRGARWAAHMTQKQVAERTGVSQATISFLENAVGSDVRISTLGKLAEVYKCTPFELTGSFP